MTPSTGIQYSPAVSLELARRLSAASQRSASRCSILARSDMAYFRRVVYQGTGGESKPTRRRGSLGGFPSIGQRESIALRRTMTGAPKITTVERHFLDRKGRNPHATPEFSWLLSGITLATKIIAAYVQRAGLLEIMG